MKALCILGSTGSIGESTLDVVRRMPGKFRVRSMTAGGNAKKLAEQAAEFQPARIAISEKDKYAELKSSLNGWRGEILAGAEALCALAEEPESDYVVSAIVGAAGLLPTLAALKSGKQVGIANKEPLVMCGPLMIAAAEKSGATILPIDSEHSAVFQSARAGNHGEIRKIVLTASGGPFRKATKEMMAKARKEDALKHPTWSMGAKITIDSATLMNKALEIIEAHFLFGVPYEAIHVWVHPQSIVHALVEFTDGSVVAQLGLPDMRLPIQYALTYPERAPANGLHLDWEKLRRLDFEAPSPKKFPCLELARAALRAGGAQPCAFNAADEVAVAAFLERRLPFLGIAVVIENVLKKMPRLRPSNIEDVLAADAEARRLAREAVTAGNNRRKKT